MPTTFFLPGASGIAAFWRPVVDRLRPPAPRLFSWPGLGDEPHDPHIKGMDDLVAMVLAEMPGPSDLVAQSMGGLIALRVALSAPEKVRRLVLVATSGGVPVGELGGADWRREYRQVYPAAAGWITAATEDLSERLPAITAPVLLIWGDRDPISPPAVGVRLLELLPNARLHTVAGAGHDLAVTRAEEVAGVIAEHLGG